MPEMKSYFIYKSFIKSKTNKFMKKIFTLFAAAVMSLGAFAQDYTSTIQNNHFEGCSKNNFPGWTISAPSGGNVQSYGTTSAEYWIGTAANGNFDYYQELTDLPNGRYTVAANMWNSSNNEPGAVVNGNAGVYASTLLGQVFAGVTDDCDGDHPNLYSTTESIVVGNGKLRVGVKNNGTMGARWFGVDYITLTKVADITAAEEAEFLAKYEEAQKYAESFVEVPTVTKEAYSNATGVLAPNWANATPYTYAESYSLGEKDADFAMSTKLQLEANTNYIVTVVGAASFTSGRGFEATTGTAADKLTGLYVAANGNEKVQYIPVVDRVALVAGANDEASFLIATGEDGVITAGIKNLQAAGNWYACAVKSIQKVELEEWSCDVTAKISVAGRSTELDQKVNYTFVTTNKEAMVVLPAAEVNGWKMEETLISGAKYTVDEDGIKSVTFPAATINFTKNGETVVATVVPATSKATINATSLRAEINAASSKGDVTVLYAPQLVENKGELTKSMFKTWTSAGADAQPAASQSSTWCDYIMNTSTDMPYGNGNVDWMQYADLTEYESLSVIATAGTPRFFLNRKTAAGQAPNDAIDTNNGDHFNAYVTKVDNGDGSFTFTLNIAKIVAEQGFAHLNVIKGGNWAKVTVTSMVLVKKEPSKPTDVEAVAAEVAAKKVAKFVKNGKVVIVKDGKAFTAAGAAVK